MRASERETRAWNEDSDNETLNISSDRDISKTKRHIEINSKTIAKRKILSLSRDLKIILKIFV